MVNIFLVDTGYPEKKPGMSSLINLTIIISEFLKLRTPENNHLAKLKVCLADVYI